VAQAVARLGHLPRRARTLGRVPDRAPGRAPLAAVTSAAVVAALFGLGVWSFNDMRAFGLGSPKPGPHCNIRQPNCPVIVRKAGRRVAPGGPATSRR
jgi:hypothetical protein